MTSESPDSLDHAGMALVAGAQFAIALGTEGQAVGPVQGCRQADLSGVAAVKAAASNEPELRNSHTKKAHPFVHRRRAWRPLLWSRGRSNPAMPSEESVFPQAVKP